MDGLVEFAQPQPFAAAMALVLLSLVMAIETVMLSLAVRRSAAPAARPPVAEEALAAEAYDWLYE